jgi:outer membrane murein-binding lipoprotein Lpp
MDLPSQDQSHHPALVQSPEYSEGESITSTSSTANGRRSFWAITHFAVLTAFILPVTLLPYLLSRRRLSSLQRQIDRTEASVRILQQDLNRAASEVATHKEENRRMRALLHQMMQETDQLRLRANQRDAEHLASDEAIRSDLRILLDERQHSRLVQYHINVDNAIETMGTSLAEHKLLPSALWGLPWLTWLHSCTRLNLRWGWYHKVYQIDEELTD